MFDLKILLIIKIGLARAIDRGAEGSDCSPGEGEDNNEAS